MIEDAEVGLEDRFLLQEDTENMAFNDTYTQALLESQPTNKKKNSIRSGGGFSDQTATELARALTLKQSSSQVIAERGSTNH